MIVFADGNTMVVFQPDAVFFMCKRRIVVLYQECIQVCMPCGQELFFGKIFFHNEYLRIKMMRK